MRIVYKKPGQVAEARNVPNTLDEWQRLVGGYIETVALDKNTLLICNEEGKLLKLQPNILFNNDIIVGPVIFVGVKDDDFIDIDRDMETRIIEFYREEM